jgi:hypothetical protein
MQVFWNSKCHYFLSILNVFLKPATPLYIKNMENAAEIIINEAVVKVSTNQAYLNNY